MTVLVYLPSGSSQAYQNAWDLKIQDGFTIFHYKLEAEGSSIVKKITTTLAILVEEGVDT
jgi:hypothetical protein